MPNERLIRLEERNKRIKEKFILLSNKKYKEKTKLYTQDTIFLMLSQEFFLAPRTIEDIVFERVEYKTKTID